MMAAKSEYCGFQLALTRANRELVTNCAGSPWRLDHQLLKLPKVARTPAGLSCTIPWIGAAIRLNIYLSFQKLNSDSKEKIMCQRPLETSWIASR